MQKLITAALAATFAAGSSLAILAGGAQQPALAHQGIFSAAPAIALADRDDNDENDNNDNNQGNEGNQGNGCVNPAGHERGRCKNNGEDDKGHNRGNRGGTSITGTVQSINGSTIYFLRNNGQAISFIDNTNRRFYVGQRVTVRVYNNNGQYALAPTNNGYNNGGYNNNGQNNRQVSGIILAVSGSTLRFINGTAIDISQAQQRGAINGSLSIGRSVTAYGYVDGSNNFHATSIQ